MDHFLYIYEEQTSPDSKLLTKDGKELIFLNTYYKISNREEIKNQILKIRGFRIKKESREKDEIIWTNYRGAVFGDVFITDKELLFEANAREHLEKWKHLIKEIPLEFLRTEELDQQALMDKLFEGMEDKLLGGKPDDISDEEFKKSVVNKWNIFYDNWFQQKSPSLDDKSPAESAKTKAGKQRVLNLIDSYENEILRTIKVQDMDNIENILKYFNPNELRKRLELL